MTFEFQNMGFDSGSQSSVGAWRYSDLHSRVTSALTGILNIKCALV